MARGPRGAGPNAAASAYGAPKTVGSADDEWEADAFTDEQEMFQWSWKICVVIFVNAVVLSAHCDC